MSKEMKEKLTREFEESRIKKRNEETNKLKSMEELKKEKLKNIETKPPKPNLKELRKNKEFMKTIYDQKYIQAKWSLTQIAKHLEEMTGTSITGKTVGNDFKGFGFKLKPSRKSPYYKPVGDIRKVDASKLKSSREELIQLQKMYIYYKIKGWKHFGQDRFESVVPPEEFSMIEEIAFGGLGIEQLRENKKELAEKDKEINRLTRRITELESERVNFTRAIENYASTLSKNPLSKELE